jgi:pyruvate/2-oxoglutarate dehydrogenase complex dihydrolipoamide acyltransferase (E2) component
VEDADSVSKFADFSPEASSAEPSTSEEEADETSEPSAAPEELVPPPKTFEPFTRRIWPTARKILAEFGVDPWEVKGSGLNGIITKDDAVATTKGMSKGQGSPKPSAPKKEEKKEEGKKGGEKDAGKKEGGKKESVGGKAAAAGGPPKKSVEPLSSGEFEDVPNSQIRRVCMDSSWLSRSTFISAF